MVGARIARMDTNYRESISLVERLAICLQFLATGDSYRTIGFTFRVGRSTVADIVPSVAQAMWGCLATRVLHNNLRRASQELLRMEMGTPNGHLPDVTRAGANNPPQTGTPGEGETDHLLLIASR
ncbi:unnamed protein product [Coregonus sp. 'balchen']|nr:unnamed protein product [Coregonus sp. 'balchen']